MKRGPALEVALAMIVVLASVLFFGSLAIHAREKARLATCQSTVKMTAWALRAYAHDWDDCLPPAGMVAEVQRRYVHKSGNYIERCPDDHTRQETSYAMPEVWSGRKFGPLEHRRGVIVLYKADHGVPAYRHGGGINVAYVDGRARWRAEETLPREAITRGTDPDPDAPQGKPQR